MKQKKHSKQNMGAYHKALRKAMKLRAKGQRVRIIYSPEKGWQTYTIKDAKPHSQPRNFKNSAINR